MKRLVGILTVLMLAVSVFAVDFSAGIKLGGDLLAYDGDNFKVISVGNQTGQWDMPMNFSVSTEKAGGSFKIWPGQCMGEFKLWFKPLEGVTVSAGEVGMSLNQEQIDWWRSNAKGEGWGYSVAYDNSGFSFGAEVLVGDGFLFESKKVVEEGKDPEVFWAPMYFQLGYDFKAALDKDFGRIAGFFKLNKKEDMNFGLGYNNTLFGSTYMFLNAIMNMSTKLDSMRFELYVAPVIEFVGIKIWVPVDYNLNADDNALGIGSVIRADLNLGAPVTPYLRVESDNFLADTFGMIIKPGITGSVGAMGYDVGIACNVGEKFTFSVPVTCTLGF